MSYSSGRSIPRLCAGFAFASVMSFSASALAASAIEEVVVTAQRTEESLQDVPIAVSAFSGEMLEAKQIINPSDLQMNTPNVSFSATNFGGSNFSIRGIGRLVIAGSGENGVSIHMNQIAVPTQLTSTEFYDMDRVEVLRGPQGTLFGRNATGGAVNMVTKMPDYEAVNGYIDAEGGDYDHRRMKGAFNLPITDNFAIRAAGMWLKRDGYIENTAHGQVGDCLKAGTTLAQWNARNTANPNNDGLTSPCQLSGIDNDIDGRDLSTYRVTAAWQIADNADAWLQYGRFSENDDRVRITNQVCQQNDLPNLGCTADGFGFENPHYGTGTGGLFGGMNGAVLLGDPNPTKAFPVQHTGFRQMNTDFEPIYDSTEDMWTGGANYEFEKYTVGLLAGYVETDVLYRQDYNMDVGPNLYATPLNPAGLWPTSAPAGKYAGADWTSDKCNYADGTAGVWGGCVFAVDETRVFTMDQSAAHNEYWTAELKLASQYDGPFNFVVGANYAEYEGFGDYYVNSNTLDLVSTYGVSKLGFPPLYPGNYDSTSDPSGNAGNTGDSTAVFGEVYYQLTDTLKLTAGLRYNDDNKEVADTGILYNSVNSELLFSPNAAVNTVTGNFLASLLLLDPAWQANAAAGREQGGVNWTRQTNLLLGALGSATALAGEKKLASYYGVTDAEWNAALLTKGFSAERFAIDAKIPIVPGFNESRDLTGSPSKVDFQETTGRIGLDWQMNDTTMIYGFYTRGYKPGGLNPPQNSTLATESVKYVFDSEQVDAFEIGAKNAFLDGSLVVNGALFAYDYGGLQTTRIRNNNSINDNIDAQIYGAELELFWQPEQFPGLAIDVGYSYLKAEVDGSTSLDPLAREGGDPNYTTLKNIDAGSSTGVNYVARVAGTAPDGTVALTPAHIAQAYAACRALSSENPRLSCPAVAPGTTNTGILNGLPTYFSRGYLDGTAVWSASAAAAYNAANPTLPPAVAGAVVNTVGKVDVSDGFNVDLDGNSLPNSPENTLHLGVAYTWDISQIGGAVTARWDWAWRDDQYAREFNTRGDEIEAWDQHNASLTYASANGLWEGRLWVRNIQDEDNVTGKYVTSDTSGFYRNYFLTEPRLWGASVKYNFGPQ